MGVMWVLSVLTASENSQFLSLLLSVCIILHAIFCLIGYCIINKRVKENLNRTVLRCLGRKVPLLDSSAVASNSSHTATATPRTPGYVGGTFDPTRRNIGISASSTTSRSTTKTSSSPYRSDGQLRHTSTSTSNYNSDAASFMRDYETRAREQIDTVDTIAQNEGGRSKRRHRKDSDSGSETDGRSLELASSHSSDEEESCGNQTASLRRKTINSGNNNSYLPNITEHVQATTPPELNVVQSPQLFPSVQTNYGSRWASQLPDAYFPSPNGKCLLNPIQSQLIEFSNKINSFKFCSWTMVTRDRIR